MLELRHVSLSFAGRAVLRDCSLSLAPGERLALMGPSGCGKTTLLRLALGLQRPDGGTAENRFLRPAAVFQEPRLLPWCSALENVTLVLPGRDGAEEKARFWLDRLGLGGAEALCPAELSGGMQQRVALARALAFEGDLLVLDEPFKGMDEELLRRVTATVSQALPEAAILLATHSEKESAALGCRILRYDNGRFAGV